MRKSIAVLGALFAASVLGLGANAAQAAKIVVGSASGAPGATVSVSVSLTSEGAQVAGTQNDITFDPTTPIARKANGKPDCTVNPDIDKTGTSFAFRPNACTAETCTAVRALVLSTENVDAIVDGSVLYTCRVAIASSATGGDKALTISGVIASDPTGTRVEVATGTNGAVTVSGGGGFTATPTNTTGVPPATPTPTTGSSCADPRPAPSGNAIYIQDQNLAAGATSGTITVKLASNTAVAGTQNDISLPAGASINRKANGKPDCTVNPDIDKTGTSFAFRPNGCAAGACTGVRALVLSTENVDPIVSGATLYTCNITVAGGAELVVSGTILSSPVGQQVAGVTSQNGIICVGGGGNPSPTPTTPAGNVCPSPKAAPSGNAIYIVDQGLPSGTTTGSITVKLVSNTDVAGSQNDISLPAGASINRKANGKPDCAVNPDIDKTGTSFAFRPNACAAGACTGVRALVLSTENVSAIASGSTLYTCNITVAGGAELVVSGTILSTPAGQQVAGVTSQNGVICVEGSVVNTPVPTATATIPVVVASATPTRTAQSVLTATATKTNTPRGEATNTPGGSGTPSPSRVESEDGCQINTVGGSSAGWLMLIPALAMFVRRRSR